jgi:hypothetical protein
MDKLRRLVAKVQKTHHPFGQGILGLTYDIWKCKEEYLGYVQQSGIILHLKKLFCYILVKFINVVFFSLQLPFQMDK